MVNIWAFVPAGGSGRRMGGEVPKQYLELDGMAVVRHTVERLMSHPRVDGVAVGVAGDDRRWAAVDPGVVAVTRAGAARADTVRNGLAELARIGADDDWVMVHDAARPLLRGDDVERLIDAALAVGGAILAMPLTDTVKQCDDDRRIVATRDRSVLWRAATPQMFPLGRLREALDAAAAAGREVTDESSAMEATGERPALVHCAGDNIKITTPPDLELARWYLRRQREETP